MKHNIQDKAAVTFISFAIHGPSNILYYLQSQKLNTFYVINFIVVSILIQAILKVTYSKIRNSQTYRDII